MDSQFLNAYVPYRFHGRHASPVVEVSVVVPTCGRLALLERCLAALCAQLFDPHCYEILVVDDRPSDATQTIVQRRAWAERGRGLEIRYVASHGPHGPAAARNRGWHRAQGDVIAFTDDDAEAEPHWLRNGLQALGAELAAVHGRIVMPIPWEPTDYERDASGLERAEFATVNCFCRKRILQQVGGFDERFAMAWREDSDLQFRILEAGARIGYAPDAVVVHPVRLASWGVSVSQQRKVMFDALLFKKHPQLYRERIPRVHRWDYYAAVTALFAVLVTALQREFAWTAVCFAVWAALTARFCLSRLNGTSRSFRHVTEMIVTSALIPPLAVFWRLVGAVKFRIRFI
jgi:GT2 family glycosyltransferase